MESDIDNGINQSTWEDNLAAVTMQAGQKHGYGKQQTAKRGTAAVC